MRASWTTMLRLCREVAYGIDSMTAVRHGSQPGVPPYPPPSLFSSPSVPFGSHAAGGSRLPQPPRA
ncbi:hypothetical protein N566_04595 [Streptomycetaceae bacterium MP113-05]|nr:hypothetical protein N566_04595 [Streptomycetaceae bacterium MP113-05]